MPVTPQVVAFPFAISNVETNFISQAPFVIVSIEFSSLWGEYSGGFRDQRLAPDARFEFPG